MSFLALLKNWKWLAMGALALALAFSWNLAQDRGAQLATRTVERDAAVKRAQEWAGAYARQEVLAAETAEARAAETNSLINLARAAGSAKQGIAHAPGADDRFRYSDAAYGFLRNAEPEAAGSPAAGAAPAVDGR